MHQNVCTPLLNYFSPDRVVSLDVSSGKHDAIWDKVHEVFTSLGIHPWRPVDSVLVFALGRATGMCGVLTVYSWLSGSSHVLCYVYIGCAY